MKAKRPLLFVLALGLTACTKHATYTILDLECGGTKLRFQENVTSNFNTTSWKESLLLARGNRWVMLDENPRYGSSGGAAFSRLLSSAQAFRSFPFDAKRPEAKVLTGTTWAVFIDPAAVSRAEYDVIASCLASNVGAIDAAFWTDRSSKEPLTASESTRDRRPQLSSIVYTRRDPQFSTCGSGTLGSLWSCAGGKAYIKTVVDDQLGQFLLCATEVQPLTSRGMVVGQISTDQSAVFLRKPEAYQADFVALMAGQRPKDYYASCRDAAGTGFFDVFSLARDESSPATAAVDRGQALFDSRRYKEALAAYQEAIRVEPSAASHRQVAQCLEKLGRSAEALDAYRKVVQLQPRNPDDRYALATRLLERKRYAEAIQHFREITVLEPAVAEGFTNLGNALNEANRLEEALKANREALRLKPNGLAYFNVGIALHNLGRTQEALAAFEKAIQVEPGYADAHYELGDELLSARRYPDAITRFSTVTRLEPDNPRGFRGLGMALHAAGRCTDAVAAFDKASRLCTTCLEPDERAAYEQCRALVR